VAYVIVSGVQDINSKYIITVPSYSATRNAAGTTIKYYHKDNEKEWFYVKGPITQPLSFMVGKIIVFIWLLVGLFADLLACLLYLLACFSWLFVCLFAYLLDCLFLLACLSISTSSFFVCLLACLLVCLFVCLFACMLACLLAWLFVYFFLLNISFYFSLFTVVEGMQ